MIKKVIIFNQITGKKINCGQEIDIEKLDEILIEKPLCFDGAIIKIEKMSYQFFFDNGYNAFKIIFE